MSVRLAGLAALVCAALSFTSPSFTSLAAEPPPAKEIFLAHTQHQDSGTVPAAAMAAEFKRQVESLSHGRLKVGIFPAGQLGGNRDMAHLVAKNVVQTAFVTVGGIAPLYPPITVTQIPFALSSAAAADAVFDGPFGRHLAEDIERRIGLMVLGYGDGGGFSALTNSKRSIHTPKDMRGLKIRTIPGFKPLETMIHGLGAVPVAVSSREEFTALGSGVIDGQMNPPLTILANRFDEVQTYATLTGHLYAPLIWVYNRDAFAGLDPAEQAAVRQAAASALTVGRSVARAIEASSRGLPALYRRMTVTTLTPAERQEFRAATQPAVTETVRRSLDEDGAALLAEFLTAAGAEDR